MDIIKNKAFWLKLVGLVNIFICLIFTSSCSKDPKLANKENFTQAINEYIQNGYDGAYCIKYYDDRFINKLVKNDILTKLPEVQNYDDCLKVKGLVACSSEYSHAAKKIVYVPYKISSKGSEIKPIPYNADKWQKVCYASVKLDKIIRWEEGNFGMHFADVRFTIKPDKVASWAKDLGFSTEPQEQKVEFVLSNDGWHSKVSIY
ncbi:MAG: hypothetical protein ACK5WP_09660 [Neisseriaceae bacterium]